MSTQPNAAGEEPAEYTPPAVKDNDTLPFLWWLNPWNTVLGLLHKVDHLKSTSRGEQAARLAAVTSTGKMWEKAVAAEKEIERAKEALGRHALHDGMTINACGIKLVPSIEKLVEEVDELRADFEAAKDGLDNMANRLNEVRSERDAATSQLQTAKEHIATMGASMERSHLDHVATLGYVRKLEAQLKRAKAKPAKKKGGAK